MMAKRIDRRTAILTASAACFARYGYAKTTLDDIGRAAQLNKASLYYYFTGKDELFIAVVLHESNTFMVSLVERVRHLATPAEQVRYYIIERLHYYRLVLHQHQIPLAVLQALEPRFDQLYADVLEREVAFLAELLTPLFPAAPASTLPEPRQLARLLLSTADALKHEAVRQRTVRQTLALPNFSATEADTLLLTNLILASIAAPHLHHLPTYSPPR
ncbi:TetR/AcrR family transcriptional regulator [Hymenobacter terrenus]|uniref:TetR/AcrR family transcriptional regulator n=1 Tax=Hymenobacter terrenus TaxID=1629124 RepID=UPI000619EC54|nr:TetR/AcrR family transcriptional regulator [Hymenobacter terrenus]